MTIIPVSAPVVVGKPATYFDPNNGGLPIPVSVLADSASWDAGWYSGVYNAGQPTPGTYLIGGFFGSNVLQYVTNVQAGTNGGQIVGAAGADTTYPRQIQVQADGLSSTVTLPVGTWTPTYLTTVDTTNFVGWVNVSDGAQNDQISFDLACGAGTYTIELLHLPFQNRGIYTVQVDGVTVGSVDGYANSLTPTRGKITGVVVSAGRHVVTLVMASKNALSSGYTGMVERLILTQTA